MLYDINNNVEAVEFYQGSKVIFYDINIFDQSYESLKMFFKKEDEKVEIDDNFLISKKYNISISSASNKIETVLFFIDGYYD